ncbi:MAG: type II secretion system GspH family protein [Turicibacter sp.]|nr:type II secretion system GspH family protein [Turicibacter sp.]
MLDDLKNENGYLLIESLLGLVLLGIMALSLVTALPVLLEAGARLDKEQAIYHRLAEFHIQELNGLPILSGADDFEAFRQGERWCGRYVWQDGKTRTICL